MKKLKFLLPVLGATLTVPSLIPLIGSCKENEDKKPIFITEPKTGDKKYLKWHTNDVGNIKILVFSGFKINRTDITEDTLIIKNTFKVTGIDFSSYISNIVVNGDSTSFDITVQIINRDANNLKKRFEISGIFQFYYRGDVIQMEEHNDYEIILSCADFIDISTGYHNDNVKMVYNDDDTHRAAGQWRIVGASYSGLEGIEDDIGDIHDIHVTFIGGHVEFQGYALNVNVYEKTVDLYVQMLDYDSNYGYPNVGFIECWFDSGSGKKKVDIIGENNFKIKEYASEMFLNPSDEQPTVTFDSEGRGSVTFEHVKYRGFDDPEAMDPKDLYMYGYLDNEDIMVDSGLIVVKKRPDPLMGGAENLYGELRVTINFLNKKGLLLPKKDVGTAFIYFAKTREYPVPRFVTSFIGNIDMETEEPLYMSDENVTTRSKTIEMVGGSSWQYHYTTSFENFQYDSGEIDPSDENFEVIPHFTSTGEEIPEDAIIDWDITKGANNTFSVDFGISFHDQEDIEKTYQLNGWLDFVWNGYRIWRSKNYSITLNAAV